MKKLVSLGVSLFIIPWAMFVPVASAAKGPIMGVAEFRNNASAYW